VYQVIFLFYTQVAPTLKIPFEKKGQDFFEHVENEARDLYHQTLIYLREVRRCKEEGRGMKEEERRR
jgi:hypothetical protein